MRWHPSYNDRDWATAFDIADIADTWVPRLVAEGHHFEELLARGQARDWGAPRPSALIKRAADQGLTRWRVSYGLPKRLTALVKLEAWFGEIGVLAPNHENAPHGHWALRVNGEDFDFPAKLSLDLLAAANGNTAFLLPAILLSHLGADKEVAMAAAARIRSNLALRRLTEILAWAKSYGLWLHAWAPVALLCLAKTPEDYRWALLHDRPPSCENGLRGLNWAALKQAKSATPAKLAYFSAEALWARMMGSRVPPDLALPCLKGFKFGLLHRLANEFKVNPAAPGNAEVQGWLPAVVQLVRLFGDYGAIQRFVRAASHGWSLKGLHDAGQFRLPPRRDSWTPAKWAPLCQRHPKAVALAQHFATLEAAKTIPTCLSELQHAVVRQGYPAIPKQWAALADVCIRAKLSSHEFEKHKAFWATVKPKPANFMPHVHINGAAHGLPGWRLSKLADTDYRGPLLGVMTGCCQHLGGAGRACAEHGVTSPFSAFYIVERKGQVVAQSWVWRNTHGGLVFDSIEALDRSDAVIQATAKLLRAAETQFLHKSLGISSLFLSTADCGITPAVRDLLVTTPLVSQTTPVDSCAYFDGDRHQLWVGQPLRTRQKLPKVDGYAPEKARYFKDHLEDRYFEDHLEALESIRTARLLRSWPHGFTL